MTVVVALVSQKGGVGKSTLARGLGAVLAQAGLKVQIADLDPQQHTVLEWGKIRTANAVKPTFNVRGYTNLEDAFSDANDVELLIVDTPGRANAATLALASNAHLVVQPTGAGLDDLYPGVLLFHELVAAGIDRHRLVFALCRTQEGEEEMARTYLGRAGYDVLPGSLPERAGYRDAHNNGRAVTETSRKELNERADAMMLELMTRVAEEVRALQQRRKSRSKKTRGAS